MMVPEFACNDNVRHRGICQWWQIHLPSQRTIAGVKVLHANVPSPTGFTAGQAGRTGTSNAAVTAGGLGSNTAAEESYSAAPLTAPEAS